jgi:pantothenate kinase
MPNPTDKVYRRGAPDTFNATALKDDLTRIKRGNQEEVFLPGFDHSIGDPEPGLHKFCRSNHHTLIVEGNYLLHDSGEWKGVSELFDATIFIKSDISQCVERLKIRNKCIPGYTAKEIEIRCEAVDRKNAETVTQDASRAHITVQGQQ